MKLKPVASNISIRKEEKRNVVISATTSNNLFLTYINRGVPNSPFLNYLPSFRFPHQYVLFKKELFLARKYPELLQLNANEILIFNIPSRHFDSFIHGKTITIELPSSMFQNTQSYTLISTFYNTDLNVKYVHSPVPFFGSGKIAYLFSDNILLPYSGTINNGTVDLTYRASWDPTPTNFTNRPFAVSFSMLKQNDYNTDNRDWNTVVAPHLNVSVPAIYPILLQDPGTNPQGYNYDIPLGFVELEKGFIIITSRHIINQLKASIRNAISDQWVDCSSIPELANISVSFQTINVRYVNSVVCTVAPKEFPLSSNPTWDFAKNLQELQNNGNNIDDIYVTEIGLYNEFNELIAIAKLNQPIRKKYEGLLNFNLEIDT